MTTHCLPHNTLPNESYAAQYLSSILTTSTTTIAAAAAAIAIATVITIIVIIFFIFHVFLEEHAFKSAETEL